MTMVRTRFALVFVLALACMSVAGAPHDAAAEGKTVIRYATLAPSGSTFGKVLKAWSRSLSKETDGRVELRYYSGGSQGDERDFIRKMRAGQMDAAGVTATGLGIILRPVLVLSSPGLIETYEQLERVRDALTPRFDEMFREAGFELLAWADAGKGRIMSTKPILRPADLRSRPALGMEGRPDLRRVPEGRGRQRRSGSAFPRCMARFRRRWWTWSRTLPSARWRSSGSPSSSTCRKTASASSWARPLSRRTSSTSSRLRTRRS